MVRKLIAVAMLLCGTLYAQDHTGGGQSTSSGGGTSFSSPSTVNQIPKFTNTTGNLASSSMNDTGTVVTGTLPLQLGDGSITTPSFSFTNNTGIGFYRAGGTDMRYASGGVDQIRLAPNFIVGAASGVNFASTGVQTVNVVEVYDGAAGVLGQRSGVTAQGHRVYNTFTDAANNEYATVDWTTSANTLTLGAVANGTGTLRPTRIIGSSLIFRTAAADKWTIASGGGLTANTDNSYDIGASGATRPRSVFVGTSVNAPVYNAGTTLLISSTAPTVSSGFGTSPSISANNGTAAFRVNVGTGGAATSGVIGLPTAVTGWNCFADDVTTSATNLTRMSASSTTTATLTNYNNAGTITAWVASDVLAVSCFAY